MKTGIKVTLGFILGSLAYAVGFVVAGIVGNLTVNLAIFLPKSIDAFSVGLTSSALGSNLLAIWIFSLLNKHSPVGAYLAFEIYLIIIATIYLTLAIIGGDTHLLWYPILSYIINGFMVKSSLDDNERESKKAGSENEQTV